MNIQNRKELQAFAFERLRHTREDKKIVAIYAAVVIGLSVEEPQRFKLFTLCLVGEQNIDRNPLLQGLGLKMHLQKCHKITSFRL